jgi:hypothetical protein
MIYRANDRLHDAFKSAHRRMKMIGAYRFDMCGTPRIAAGENLYGECAYLAADVQLENTLFAPRGRGCVPD